MVRFRNREERERYMDSLERQMEHQREEIGRTLDEIQCSGRQTALKRLRSSLPNVLNRTSVRDAEGGARRPQNGRIMKPRETGGSSGARPGLLSTALALTEASYVEARRRRDL